MKKFTAFALVLVLVASLLFGCAASNENGGAVADNERNGYSDQIPGRELLLHPQ